MALKSFRTVCRAAALVALSTVAMSRSASAAPLTFVYKGAGCTGKAIVNQFQTVLGRPVDGVSDFVDWTSSWSNMVVSTNWIAGCWQGSGYKLSLSVPLMVAQHDASPLHELAAGNFNTYFTQIAQKLVAHGYGDAYIRLGEEFNQGYYPWAANNSPTLWIQGYRQAQAAMKAVPGAHFKFVWNPSLYMGQFYPYLAYPGDDVVDVMGTDAYNATWDPGYTDPNSRWNSVLNDSWGIAQFVAFAKAHNKPYAFPEWGTGTRGDGHGGGDDPLFIANMAPFVAGSEYAGYWDFNAGDYNATLSGSPQPAALAAFIAEFGTTTGGSGSSIAEEKTIGAIVSAGAKSFTPQVKPTVTCTNCHVAVIQNAPNHWLLITWALTAQPSASVSWGVKAATSNLYDPSVGATPTRAMGTVSSTPLALTPGKPQIVAIQM